MKRNQNNSGFTLIELMVVMLFLAIIGVYTWTYLRTTITTQKTIENKISIQQQGLSIMSRLQEDISQVFFVDSYQKLTFFNGEAESLTFTSLSHDAPNPDDRESEEAEITYTLDTDVENADRKMLLRKEVPFLDGEQEKNDEYLPLVVAHQILNLEFAYSDDGEKFSSEWNIAGADHPNKLPKLVRVRLTIKDKDEREEYFENLIDLPMSDDLNVKAATQNKTDSGNTKSTDKTSKPSSVTTSPAQKGGVDGSK
jgi:prepilin-type N-terminal cleavage/methylation domain-containing protein